MYLTYKRKAHEQGFKNNLGNWPKNKTKTLPYSQIITLNRNLVNLMEVLLGKSYCFKAALLVIRVPLFTF